MPLARPAQPIRLHAARLSGHAHRAKLFLSLLGLPFETIEVDLRAGEQKSSAFLTMNPFGLVPVIEDGDVVLFDSNAILVYLAKRYGDPAWLPVDPVGAARVEQWLSIAAGPIAYGPCAARLVKVFGAPHHYDTAVRIALELFDVIEPELGKRPFAIGTHPTIADVAAYTYIAHAPEGGISLTRYPNIRAWLARVEALPGFVPMPTFELAATAA
ncbi:glutathione S-transferase family protein [Trinickia dinghuensis]|uniref:Glutathione S-transferase n=1 Tax=Trinickia dinghuensis TaxID=2291023 RepID=A0A3D8K067_9BURK|nr:glutathione S-transferase [Trinickia dinghuensis]RDU98245.1 glutathione S-transferase [Trinickia dinghuensis]